MSQVFVTQTAPPSPPLERVPTTAQVHALSAGHLTLPEQDFVHPASDEAKTTVSSLAFLIQHENLETRKKTRIVFDLEIRRNLERYSEPIQKHVATRQPISTDPDVVKSLKAGGLNPSDIDYIIYSHASNISLVYWDHVGDLRDFLQSTFVVRNSAMDLLHGTSTSLHRGHSFFESDLIPQDRTIELSSPMTQKDTNIDEPSSQKPGLPNFHPEWTYHLNLPYVVDLFQDGSVYIVEAPGHLPGHINLLVRTGINQSVYLAGDACHDRRILRKERTIGTWADAERHTCCIHANREKAEETIDRIRELERQGIEVIFAHDLEWEKDPQNRGRFWGLLNFAART